MKNLFDIKDKVISVIIPVAEFGVKVLPTTSLSKAQKS